MLTININAFNVELVKTNPAPIKAGDYADITLRFTNTGENTQTKNNVYFKIKETKFIQPMDNNDEIINKVFSGETLTRTYRVFFSNDLKEGYIDLPIIVGYNGIKTETNSRVFIEDAQRMPEFFVGQITTTPNELIADSKNNKLTVNLQNLGDKAAELVTAKLIPKTKEIEPSYSYSLEDSLSSIKAGAQGKLTFTIDIEKNVQSEIPATLLLRYRSQKNVGNTYETFEKKINITIPITPSPYLVIEKVELLDDFKLGTIENKVRVTIKNEGLEDAEEVRIRIVPDISYPFIFEEVTKYVTAKIKPQESATIEFKVEVIASGEVKKYDSIVILESLVEDNRYSREDIVSIQTKPGQKINNSYYAYLIVGIIILVSLVLGFNTYRSHKNNNKKK